MAAANQAPPMVLRINARRGTVAGYLQRLAAAGLPAQPVADPAFGGHALVLDQACPVHLLPGFADGGLVAATPGRYLSTAGATAIRSTSTANTDRSMQVVNNFTVQAPNGSVSRATEQQIAAAAARGVARANARNN